MVNCGELNFCNNADFAKVPLLIVVMAEMAMIGLIGFRKTKKLGWKKLTLKTSGIRMLRISR